MLVLPPGPDDEQSATAHPLWTGRASTGRLPPGSGGHADQKNQRGNLFLTAENQQRGKASEKSTKPGEAEAANEQRPRISEKFGRRFENVVQARASDAGQTCDADNQESVGGDSPSAKIGLQDISRDQQASGDHQAKRWKCQGAEVKVRDHSLSVMVS